jgi:hypothetical protein
MVNVMLYIILIFILKTKCKLLVCVKRHYINNVVYGFSPTPKSATKQLRTVCAVLTSLTLR